MAFPYLPGVTLNLADLGLKIAPPPAGPKVTLLGYCSNTHVPLNEPLVVTNIGKVTNALWAGAGATVGLTGASELAIAVEEAAAAGAQNIEIVCIGHISGSAYDNAINPASAAGAGARYYALSGAYANIKQSPLTIVHPVNAWVDCKSHNFGKQLADFCHQASDDIDNACIGVLPMMNPIEWAFSNKASLLKVYGTGAGGSNNALGTEVNSIADASDWYFGLPSIALITDWVKFATEYTAPYTLDTAGQNPAWWGAYLDGSEGADGGAFDPDSDTNTATAVKANYFSYWQAANKDGSLDTDNKGNKVDAGRRICVFGAPLVTANTQVRNLAKLHGAAMSSTYYNTNGASAYAGFITTLQPQSAPTNKRINNLRPLRPLSPEQANLLAARRITTMHNRANGFVVTSSMTGAHNVSRYVRSDFVRLTTMRIVDAVIDIVRGISDGYIGEPNTASARNALANEIEKFLKQMRVANALQDWQMYISATPDQQVLGEATIDLTLVPAFELIKIEANISLAKEL